MRYASLMAWLPKFLLSSQCIILQYTTDQEFTILLPLLSECWITGVHSHSYLRAVSPTWGADFHRDYSFRLAWKNCPLGYLQYCKIYGVPIKPSHFCLVLKTQQMKAHWALCSSDCPSEPWSFFSVWASPASITQSSSTWLCRHLSWAPILNLTKVNYVDLLQFKSQAIIS